MADGSGLLAHIAETSCTSREFRPMNATESNTELQDWTTATP